jgi:hypothetical protein
LAAGAAVVVPVHAGLTSAVPHGAHRWLVALLVPATAALLGGAHAVAGQPAWAGAALAAVCLPVLVAAAVGLAPGFLGLVAPLIGALLAVHLLLAAAARLAGAPWWRTVPAGALIVAWPVATALPIT